MMFPFINIFDLKFFATLLATFLSLFTFRYNFLFFCFNNLSNSLITIIWKLYACLGLFVLLILLFVVIYERRNMHWQYTKWCILVKQEWNGRTDQMLIKYVCIHFNITCSPTNIIDRIKMIMKTPMIFHRGFHYQNDNENPYGIP